MKLRREKSNAGFTLVEIMIVVAIIGLLAAIAIPSMAKARATAQRRACTNNLRVIDGAKDQWAIETKKVSGSRARKSEINPYIKGGVTPKCPAAGTYRYGPVDSAPTCTILDHNVYGDATGEDDED